MTTETFNSQFDEPVGTQRLTEQLLRITEKAGASSASVYLPTPWEPNAPALLIHAGDNAPLPELASIEAADTFASQVNETGLWGEVPVTLDGLVSSISDAGFLIPVPLLTSLWAGGVMPARGPGQGPARRRNSDRTNLSPAAGWVGLRMPTMEGGVISPSARAVVQLAHALASTVVSLYGLLTDPLTGLPGRNELHGALRVDLHRARRRRLPCSLVLVNPIGLDWVNARHGRRTGDAVVREFVQMLQALLRRSDVLMRYGGAIFALPLGNVGADAAALVGERVRSHVASRGFLNDTLHLRCAVGAISAEGPEVDTLEPLDLLQRANEALGAARQRGGGEIVMWGNAAPGPTAPPTDRLFGIFTGRTDKDYRNMGLLWDVLQVLSSASGTGDLAQKVVGRLVALLRPTRAGLFIVEESGLRLVYGQTRVDGDDTAARALGPGDISEAERALMSDAVAAGAARQASIELREGDTPRRPQLALAVPLITDGRTLGALCLVGSPEVLDLDRTDIPVLTGVAAQLAVALDREHLAELNRVRAEHERRRLQAEVQDLRTALQQSAFVFQSPVMADLLGRTRRVASTDTTVLITGESGTGKEMLAQTLHQLSGRRTKPFVIVDCGAIPATLIDSELFGHERGAFTGAQQRSLGRLAQADGGTVFLDEVGELPLDVQSRLLRFVQEKTISMVGGTRARTVDVRIVAATNRRLEDEVRAGRFREDLFYRLNVVRLHIPPLRDRPEDVRLLAEHFARTYAAEQRKTVNGFTPEAERRLAAHGWPGNVRELQNTILQAVVMGDGDRLDASDLSLPAPLEAGGVAVPAAVAAGTFALSLPGLPAPSPAAPAPAAPLTVAPIPAPLAPAPPSLAPASDAPAGVAPARATPFDEAWGQLREVLTAAVEAAMITRDRASVPLGRWLESDLTLAVHAHSRGVRAAAAARLGLPQTTFARRLREAESDRAFATRPASWDAVRAALGAVAGSTSAPSAHLAADVNDLLLDIVTERVPGQLAFASRLMGLSTPTMKRRLEARARAIRPG